MFSSNLNKSVYPKILPKTIWFVTLAMCYYAKNRQKQPLELRKMRDKAECNQYLPWRQNLKNMFYKNLK
jgi:hypothetical protein